MDAQTGPEGCILPCPIGSKLEEVCKVSVEGDPLRVHVSVFWTRPSAKGIYKVPIFLLRKINIRVIKYLSDVLILSQAIQEAHISRDTVIYLLQNLGFIINIKKSILHPWQKIEFLGMEIDLIKMTLSLTPENVQKVAKSLSFYNSSGINQGYKSPIIHYISSGTCKDSVKISSTTTNFVSKGKNELSVSNNIIYQVKNRINLVDRKLEVLQWPNFFSIEPTNNYSNRCFPDRVGSSLQRGSNIRQWSEEKRTLHINVLELLAIKLAPFSFTKGKRVKTIHFQINKKAALSYLFKVGGTKNDHMIKLSK